MRQVSVWLFGEDPFEGWGQAFSGDWDAYVKGIAGSIEMVKAGMEVAALPDLKPYQPPWTGNAVTDDITREPLARAVLSKLARTRGPNDPLGSLAHTVLSGEGVAARGRADLRVNARRRRDLGAAPGRPGAVYPAACHTT